MTGAGAAGRRVLVTGATGGIGGATARLLAGAGARLVLTGRDGPALDRIADELATDRVAADLSDATGVAAVVAAAGEVAALVDCAGRGSFGPLAAAGPQLVDDLVGLDLAAPLRLVRALLPGMLAAGRGHVVLVSSIAGRVGVPGEVAYSAAKAGVHGLAEALRYEVAGDGIRVTEVVPGAVDTAFFDRRGSAYQRDRPRPVPPEAVAAAIAGVLDRPRDEVFVPGWLAVPVRLAGVAPGLSRRLAARAMR